MTHLPPYAGIKGIVNLFARWLRPGLRFALRNGQAYGDLQYWLWPRDQPHSSGVTVFQAGGFLRFA